jgi:hypothetical protein
MKIKISRIIRLTLSAFLLGVACNSLSYALDNSNSNSEWNMNFKRTWGPCRSGKVCLDEITVNNLCIANINLKGTNTVVSLQKEKCEEIEKSAVNFALSGNDACFNANLMDLNEVITVIINGKQVHRNVTACKNELIEKIRSFMIEPLN